MSEYIWQEGTGPQASSEKEPRLRGYDPLKEISHWQLIIFTLAAGLVLFTYILTWSTNNSSATSDTWSFYGFLASICIFCLVWIGLLIGLFISLQRTRQKHNVLRRAVLSGQDLPLVPSQPDPFHAAPFYQRTLPLRLESHLKKSLTICTAVAASLIVGDVLLCYTYYSHLWKIPAILAGFSPMLCLALSWVLFGTSVVIQNRIREFYLLPWLQVDGEGITALYGRDTVSMNWRDIRYFALANTIPRGNKDKKNTGKLSEVGVFEISDGENMICWPASAPSNVRRLLLLGEPIQTPQVYETFLQHLVVLIVEHTGLPLYDFRVQKKTK